ncbi:hypothetical protein [Streptomyces hebeiensis]
MEAEDKQTDSGQVDEFTAARIRKAKQQLLDHPAGEPLRASEIAPFLRDPSDMKGAEAVAESLNRCLDQLESDLNGGGPRGA